MTKGLQCWLWFIWPNITEKLVYRRLQYLDFTAKRQGSQGALQKSFFTTLLSFSTTVKKACGLFNSRKKRIQEKEYIEYITGSSWEWEFMAIGWLFLRCLSRDSLRSKHSLEAGNPSAPVTSERLLVICLVIQIYITIYNRTSAIYLTYKRYEFRGFWQVFCHCQHEHRKCQKNSDTCNKVYDTVNIQ